MQTCMVDGLREKSVSLFLPVNGLEWSVIAKQNRFEVTLLSTVNVVKSRSKVARNALTCGGGVHVF